MLFYLYCIYIYCIIVHKSHKRPKLTMFTFFFSLDLWTIRKAQNIVFYPLMVANDLQ